MRRTKTSVQLRQPTSLNPLLDATSTAAYLGVDRRTLTKYVSNGDLAAIRLPRSGYLRFRPESIATFVATAEALTAGCTGKRTNAAEVA